MIIVRRESVFKLYLFFFIFKELYKNLKTIYKKINFLTPKKK
jgi:hypothetical protein